MSSCACGDNWRIEACDLRTGTVRAILHPTSADWQTILNGVGTGTLNLPTESILIRDVWPHLTSVYISRIAGGTATPENPVVEYAGLIEAVSASDSGGTQVGLQSLEEYLYHREIRETVTLLGTPQTEIAAALVRRARVNGIPLEAVAATSQYPRDRTYHSWDRKIIGEALEDLSNVIGGLDWELSHEKSGGRWVTTLVFRDRVGEDRNQIIQSDREAAGYDLVVDASEHATNVEALGSGEEEDQMVARAVDASGIYPQFDASPSFQDVSIQSTLIGHAEGYLNSYREPVAVPSAVIYGLDPDPRELRLGDTVTSRINFGAVTFNGKARLTGISWSLTPDTPEARTLDLLPLGRASETVLSQAPTDECEDC